MKRKTIGKIQLILGIILLILAMVVLFYVKHFFNTSAFTDQFKNLIPLNKTISGFEGFSNESKAIISSNAYLEINNYLLAVNSMLLNSALAMIITTILSIMLILGGLANISDE